MEKGDPAGRPYVSAGVAHPTFLHKGLGVGFGEKVMALIKKPLAPP
jgi:hypothetical protein